MKEAVANKTFTYDELIADQGVGFSISPHVSNERLQVITLQKGTYERFVDLSHKWPVQALEYKPFLRFAIADLLDQCCAGQLGKLLTTIISDRERAGFMVELDQETQLELTDSEEQRDIYVKLSTAVSHLIGIPNFDAMYGKYYARFTVKNTDNSDSYLRQAHRRMELHNDGTYVNERTDFVLMMKMDEKNMEMGDSIILHLDDWQDLEKFYYHPMAKQEIVWAAPPSKNVATTLSHPVFFEEDANGKPHMLFIDQFAQPQNMAQGLYLHQLSESLESESRSSNIRVNTGSMLVLQNHVWLHGRDRFVAHPNLSRELLRQRGHFTQ